MEMLDRKAIACAFFANGSSVSGGTLVPARRDSDLEQELQSHIDMAAEEKGRRGPGPDAASRAARIEAGGASQAMDAFRDQRGLPWLEDLARKVSHGLRTRGRTPVFTVVALLNSRPYLVVS